MKRVSTFTMKSQVRWPLRKARSASSVLVPALLLLLGAQAQAACTGDQMTNTITEADLQGMVSGRDVPVGTVIHTIHTAPRVPKVVCNGDGNTYTFGFVRTLPAVPGMDRVYETGIPGIAVRVNWIGESTIAPSPSPPPVSIGPWGNNGRWEYTPKQEYLVELIKSGPIKSGRTANLNVETNYSGLRSNRLIFNNVPYTARVLGCSIMSDAVAKIDLPTIHSRDLGRIGATAGARGFYIDLKCNQGVKVAYRVDAPEHDNNVIKNEPGDDMAKGVGVQLVKGDASSNLVQPLETRTEFRPTETVVENQILSIPLAARYYQTAATVSGGRVQASATVTLFYE